MHKGHKKLSKSEKDCLKKFLALPQNEFEDELLAVLDLENFFDEKHLKVYRKKFKKEINELGKRTDINAILQKVQALSK